MRKINCGSRNVDTLSTLSRGLQLHYEETVQLDAKTLMSYRSKLTPAISSSKGEIIALCAIAFGLIWFGRVYQYIGYLVGVYVIWEVLQFIISWYSIKTEIDTEYYYDKPITFCIDEEYLERKNEFLDDLVRWEEIVVYYVDSKVLCILFAENEQFYLSVEKMKSDDQFESIVQHLMKHAPEIQSERGRKLYANWRYHSDHMKFSRVARNR